MSEEVLGSESPTKTRNSFEHSFPPRIPKDNCLAPRVHGSITTYSEWPQLSLSHLLCRPWQITPIHHLQYQTVTSQSYILLKDFDIIIRYPCFTVRKLVLTDQNYSKEGSPHIWAVDVIDRFVQDAFSSFFIIARIRNGSTVLFLLLLKYVDLNMVVGPPWPRG